MLDKLFFIHNTTIKNISLKFKRYLYSEIDWAERCICVTGARGTGKTTMLLQYVKEHYSSPEECLYISADNVEVSVNGLYKTAVEFFNYGGKALVIDEAHKYPLWQIEVKNIIDTFKDKKVLISGSSSLDLKQGKADLSRRLAYYDLKGMSFREYLKLTRSITVEAVSLEDVLNKHTAVARELSVHGPVLKLFSDYLKHGYYPFIAEGESVYLQKVLNIIEKVFYEDIAITANLKRANISVIKRLLWVVATSSPFSVNIDKLSKEIRISKEYLYSYIEYLEDAGLLSGLYTDAKGFKLIRKPAKLYIENTNLLVALCGSLRSAHEQGMLRETFFVNQLKQNHKITTAEAGDFLVDSKYVFEIGGKNKNYDQIKGIKNSFIAADRIETGIGNKIPLYLFGLLY